MCGQGMQKTVVAQQGGFGTDTCRDRIIKEDITFEETEGLGQLCIEHICWCHFPTAFVHFMFLAHILVILKIFQNFSLSFDYSDL